jgi:hypothetical protein
MSAIHKRAARRELQAARLLGVARQQRLRFESKPDLAPLLLRCGITLQCEVKTRKKLPRLLVTALAQAKRYEPEAIPAAILSETGGQPIICLPLRDFQKIAGIEVV